MGVCLSENSCFFKAEISGSILLGRPDHNMIQKLDLQHASTFLDAPSQAEISLTWCRIAGGMIVHKDKRISGMADRRLKDFAWVSKAFVQASL